jgi:hypothetical protein
MYINLRTTVAKSDNENFRFEIGDVVAHADGLVGEVVDRHPAPRCGDVYAVIWTSGHLAGVGHYMCGEVLQPAESMQGPAPAVIHADVAA